MSNKPDPEKELTLFQCLANFIGIIIVIVFIGSFMFAMVNVGRVMTNARIDQPPVSKELTISGDNVEIRIDDYIFKCKKATIH